MIKEFLRDNPAWSLTVLTFSLAAFVARLLGASPTSAIWLGSPALLLAAWAALGHLITIDDDYPGGWSNPDQDKTAWRRSLKQLLAKFLVLAVVALLLFFPFL